MIFSALFNVLEDKKICLKLREKYYGDDDILPFYYYDIFSKNTNLIIEKISIRIGDNYHNYYNGNIGYEIDEKYQGNSYSYYASKLVLQVARFHGMKYIYITCKESNIASIKIIRKLNAVLVDIAEVPP